MLIKFCHKNWHYCKRKSPTSVNNHYFTCYSEMRACSQIALVLDIFWRKEETRMLLWKVFMPPLNDAFKNENQLVTLTSSKGTTKTNTHSFCFENKLATDDCGRITIKIPQKIWAFFVAAQNYYNCQINFVNIE